MSQKLSIPHLVILQTRSHLYVLELTNIVQRGRLRYICFKNKLRNLRFLKTNDSKRKKMRVLKTNVTQAAAYVTYVFKTRKFNVFFLNFL